MHKKTLKNKFKKAPYVSRFNGINRLFRGKERLYNLVQENNKTAWSHNVRNWVCHLRPVKMRGSSLLSKVRSPSIHVDMKYHLQGRPQRTEIEAVTHELSSGLTREVDTAGPDMPSARFSELVLIKSKKWNRKSKGYLGGRESPQKFHVLSLSHRVNTQGS